ncbi:unnamed protein product [Acanthoscelides obtectus]|uniref:Uncharacterized protein n=1 Tax=Acanthoscelides obtectus TaxID=200917 RepID=A0A9P0VUN0_ACAOB|nr:unnamed protein product [Acanthoscelides obtectus]CAK1683727.1 hypothetical protein AOBTE_LOCUS34429 [Acanthoscelides obtectus]
MVFEDDPKDARHEALVSLLNKLTQFYKLPPIEFEQRRTVNAEHIKTLKINKKWYLSQIKRGTTM